MKWNILFGHIISFKKFIGDIHNELCVYWCVFNVCIEKLLKSSNTFFKYKLSKHKSRLILNGYLKHKSRLIFDGHCCQIEITQNEVKMYLDTLYSTSNLKKKIELVWRGTRFKISCEDIIYLLINYGRNSLLPDKSSE